MRLRLGPQIFHFHFSFLICHRWMEVTVVSSISPPYNSTDSFQMENEK